MLFLSIFYYHPKSYTGIVPFRTVSVAAQTSGPVTKIIVQNFQRVKKGDLLFQIENETQKAALAKALTVFQSLDASEAKTKNAIQVAEANVTQANTTLTRLKEDLVSAEILLKKKVGRADTVRLKRADVENANSALAATQAQLRSARTELTDALPAARNAADADYSSAKVNLDKTHVRAFSGGIVTQMALSVGSPASQLIFSPAMVIIPDRNENEPVRVVAGFSQVANNILHVGMPAEITCNTNSNLSMENVIMAARVVSIQPTIAIGQVTPSGALIEPNSRAQRGSLLVSFELVHKEQEAMLVYGSGCLVQAYTDNLEGTIGHIIAATGIIKALLLRIKAWGILMVGVGLAGESH